MIKTLLRNPLFAETYQVFWTTRPNKRTLYLERLTQPNAGGCFDLQTTTQLIQKLTWLHQPLIIRVTENPPANEILNWLETNQKHFPNVRMALDDEQPRSLPDFFQQRRQAAKHFINQITQGYPTLPMLPLQGRLPNQENFYLTDWTMGDTEALSQCIDRMYQHYEQHQQHLAQSNHIITAQNMGDAYRLFWFFEDRNEQNTSRDMATRFIQRATQERLAQPTRDVYRLAIRNQNFEPVGGITVNMLPRPNAPLSEQGDIGYFIDPEHAGQRYVSSAMDILLPFYFKTHEVLSLDIVSTPIGQPHDNLKNNLLSQRAAIHFGAHQSSEAPHKDFTKGGYIPWRLTRENFYANRRDHVCHVFERSPRAPEFLRTQPCQTTGNEYIHGR